MGNETPPGQTFSSNETALPVEQRAPLKRKSDEILGNDQKRRQRSEESSIVEQDRRVIISELFDTYGLHIVVCEPKQCNNSIESWFIDVEVQIYPLFAFDFPILHFNLIITGRIGKRTKYFSVGDYHFNNFDYLFSWLCIDIVRRKFMLVTLGSRATLK